MVMVKILTHRSQATRGVQLPVVVPGPFRTPTMSRGCRFCNPDLFVGCKYSGFAALPFLTGRQLGQHGRLSSQRLGYRISCRSIKRRQSPTPADSRLCRRQIRFIRPKTDGLNPGAAPAGESMTDHSANWRVIPAYHPSEPACVPAIHSSICRHR